MKVRDAGLVAMVAAVFGACGLLSTEPDPIVIRIRGSVTSSADGSGVEGARVTYGSGILAGQDTILGATFDQTATGENGRFTISDDQICEEPFIASFEVWKMGFERSIVFRTLQCTEGSQVVDIELRPLDA